MVVTCLYHENRSGHSDCQDRCWGKLQRQQCTVTDAVRIIETRRKEWSNNAIWSEEARLIKMCKDSVKLIRNGLLAERYEQASTYIEPMQGANGQSSG